MKKSLVATVFAGVVVLFLSGCATTEQSLQKRGLSPLSHSKLEMLFSRTREERFVTASGVSGTAQFTRQGKAEVAWNGGGDNGTWRIKGNTFCTKYSSVRSGEETCFTLYETQSNKYAAFFPDGSLDANITFTN